MILSAARSGGLAAGLILTGIGLLGAVIILWLLLGCPRRKGDL